MSKKTPGLRKKGQYWHVEKVIAGKLIRCSTGETELEKAEQFLAKLIKDRRSVVIYGERIERTFNEAAAKYIEENEHKRSLDRDIVTLKNVMPYIGEKTLRTIYAGTLQEYINDRKRAGIKAGTLNRDLSIIGRVLELSARLWRDENGNPWLDTPPMLPKVSGEKRKPRPINHAEQSALLKNMPSYLADMCLFAVNTGLRDQEICGLKWEHECQVNGTNKTVFIIDQDRAKNQRERIVPLNSIAQSIIENRRQYKSDYVFGYCDKKLFRINNRAWKKAVKEAGLTGVRVHDLRHTFGMRLRAVGVSHEDRQDLLGHYCGNITTHYSQVKISHLIDCVEMLCEQKKAELTLVRKKA